MPELPEVETVVRDLLNAGIVGRTVPRVRVYWPRTVEPLSVRTFWRRLSGEGIVGVERRAKYIILRLSGDSDLLIHLRMTGQIHLVSNATAHRQSHEHVILDLDDGRQLRYLDSRKFGRWCLTADVDRALRHLGPEPLAADYRVSDFIEAIRDRRGMLKPLLLNQRFIAGLGNIYVDETLWDAGLHPRREASRLTDVQRRQLYRSIRKVLRRGIRALGTTLGDGKTNFYSISGRRGRNRDALRVFRRTGAPCPRCGDRIQRITVAQRGSHICPRCQPLQ